MTEKNNYQILIVGPYPPPYGGISVHIERLKNILVNSGIYECRILDVSGVDTEKKKVYKNIKKYCDIGTRKSDASIQVFKRVKTRFNSTVNNCKYDRVFSKNPPAQAGTSKI